MTRKTFNIVYIPSDQEQRCLITLPNGIDSLVPPITITREEQATESQKTLKRRTELIDVEDEYFVKLKQKEKAPLLITDSEHTSLTGTLMDTTNLDAANNPSIQCPYFVLINTGTCLKLCNAKFWYRFSPKIICDISLEEAEHRMKTKTLGTKKLKKEDLEIDYEEKFDDDSENDLVVEIENEQELNETGEALQKLMSNYENESSEDDESVKSADQDKKKTDKKPSYKNK